MAAKAIRERHLENIAEINFNFTTTRQKYETISKRNLEREKVLKMYTNMIESEQCSVKKIKITEKYELLMQKHLSMVEKEAEIKNKMMKLDSDLNSAYNSFEKYKKSQKF